MTNDPASILGTLREEIQRIDAGIVALLAERMQVVRTIGETKRGEGLAVVDPSREAAVVAHVAQLARKVGLPEDDVRELFWRIMSLSRKAQAAP